MLLLAISITHIIIDHRSIYHLLPALLFLLVLWFSWWVSSRPGQWSVFIGQSIMIFSWSTNHGFKHYTTVFFASDNHSDGDAVVEKKNIRGTFWMVHFLAHWRCVTFGHQSWGTPALRQGMRSKRHKIHHQNFMGLWGTLTFRPKSAVWAFHFATQMLMSDQTPWDWGEYWNILKSIEIVFNNLQGIFKTFFNFPEIGAIPLWWFFNLQKITLPKHVDVKFSAVAKLRVSPAWWWQNLAKIQQDQVSAGLFPLGTSYIFG